MLRKGWVGSEALQPTKGHFLGRAGVQEVCLVEAMFDFRFKM